MTKAKTPKARVATVWLDGCSGCHMSLLDIDERLILLADKIDLVYSPLVDAKDFPENVDVAIVEGAVSNTEDLHKIKLIRKNSRVLVSLGDCAVTGNIPSMRTVFPLQSLLDRVYDENATINKKVPTKVVPKLLEQVHPLHEIVPVDVYVPGCPPSADTIFLAISELLEGRVPQLNEVTRFGA
ncbi:MAG: NADP oxidoreductase [Acidobacteriota bacterium]|nr:NADP oxidoreductase [Acidobacteriota bacterium]